jgi:hypothetical protein
MRPTRLALALLALSLALPASAAAKLPDPSSDLIVIGKSLGGVTLGHSFASAKAAWGSTRGKCQTSPTFSSCRYAASLTKSLGEGSISADNGKVSSVNISAGRSSSGKPIFPAALKALKTSKGVGLSSTATALKTAYKHIKHQGSGAFVSYYLTGPGKAITNFTVTNGKVTQIVVRDGIHQG